MESLIAPSTSQSPFSSAKISYSRYEADLLIVQQTLSGTADDDSSSVSIDDLYKGLSISADKILEKLNEILKGQLPDGIQSLKPEDVTPEATADRIVSGSTAFFDIFAKQNPNLSPEELITKFMSEIRKGIETGYGEAFEILEGLGAFEFDGVKAGIEQTKLLIEDKLKAFESLKRQDLGLGPKVDADSVAEVSKNETLKQAGGLVLNLVA